MVYQLTMSTGAIEYVPADLFHNWLHMQGMRASYTAAERAAQLARYLCALRGRWVAVIDWTMEKEA